MKVLSEQFIVYLGDDIVHTTSNIESANRIFDSLPSGQGKAPSKRRFLVKEQTLREDTR